MAIDPYWAWAYWDVHSRALEQARRRSGDPAARLILRFHEVTWVHFDGKNANETFDVPVEGAKGNYYLDLWSPKKSLIAELGMKSKDGRFLPVVRSNPIDLPRDAESPHYDERISTVLPAADSLWKPRAPPLEAASPSQEPEDLSLGMPGHVAEAALASPSSDEEAFEPNLEFSSEWAPGPSAAGRQRSKAGEFLNDPEAAVLQPEGPQHAWEALASNLEREFLSPAWRESIGISSAGLPSKGEASSLEQPVRDERPQLEVKADIVIYGRACPGTDVVIDGVQVPVRSDGTFDLRFALPPFEKADAAHLEGPSGRASRSPMAPSPQRVSPQRAPLQRVEPAPNLNGPRKKEG
jgi:hypothetical protein